MISQLEGTLIEINPLWIVLDVGGVGYQVHIPLSTNEHLPPLKQKLRLFIYPVYRQDMQSLYGFKTQQERTFFQLLVEKVNGVGPRVALGLLSKLSISFLKNAILSGNSQLLQSCPGIGKKTAERVIIELREILSKEDFSKTSLASQSTSSVSIADNGVYEDAIAGLLSLGYKAPEADKALQKALKAHPPDGTSAGELIRAVLRS